jgi:asparagine synthase (glutamine-hydrolysing)
MCGIAGLLVGDTRRGDAIGDLARSMADTLTHRGPDAAGSWVDESRTVAFGHRRLSVVDLTPAGSQPMTSRDGRWTICYNGELYNTEALRAMVGLPTSGYRGHSDTEVLVELVAARGVEFAVREAIGMFAFAMWDSRERQLWLGRDRFGEKPLYIAQAPGLVAFASEIRAVRALPGVDTSIDEVALHDLVKYGYVVGERSILRGVRRVAPGSILCFGSDLTAGSAIRYWSPHEASVESHSRAPLSNSELLDLLADVVESRMVADVPLGAFLSGGIDSSLVVALMSKVSSSPVKTFTIGFGNRDYDESIFAKRVAAHLGTDHHEWILGDADVLSVIPKLPSIYDEPFADSSQIPTFLVSQLTRQHVTVALSGDGGDELFGGYERYKAIARYESLFGRIPSSIGRGTGRVLKSRSIDEWNRSFGRLPRRVLPGAIRHRSGERIHKLAHMLESYSVPSAYDQLMSANVDPTSFLVNPALRFDRVRTAGPNDPLSYAMLHDTTVYLPDDILTKVDRASMANSLEVRVPLLDPRVFDAAWRIPRKDLIVSGDGKLPLRNALKTFLPDDLVDRPKKGFGVPMAEWLRGPLRQWGDELLDPVAMNDGGLLVGSVVLERWDAHQAGSADFSVELWPILMFQSWLNEWN